MTNFKRSMLANMMLLLFLVAFAVLVAGTENPGVIRLGLGGVVMFMGGVFYERICA